MERQGRALIGLCCTLVIGLFGVYAAISRANDDEMLEVVKAGSKNAVSLIESGRGKVTVRERRIRQGGAIAETESVYDLVFAGNRYKLAVVRTIIKNEPLPGRDPNLSSPIGSTGHCAVAISGTEVVRLAKGKAIVGDANVPNSFAHAIFIGYMRNVSVSGRMIPGNGILDIQGFKYRSPYVSEVTARIVGHDTVDGSDCTLVELSALPARPEHSKRVFLIWVDPRKGFTIPRLRSLIEGGPYTERTLLEESNVQLKEYAPGVWYPAKVTRTYYKPDGSKRRTVDLTYAPDFQINVPVSDEELELTLPSGTKVHDEILGEDYIVP